MKIPRFRFFKKQIGIVYSHEYNHSLTGKDIENIFDPLKYKKIRDLLVARNLVSRKRILIPNYVSYEDLRLVHTSAYLKKIQNPVSAGEILNLEGLDPWDSFILEYFRVMTGGTLLATKFAVEHKSAAFNLGGGFHHAHPDRGSGFCLLNDVAVAIEKFRKKGLIKRPMIVDLDYHQGDGNLLFYQNDADVFTFSIHASDWVNIDKEHNRDIVLPENCNGKTYLNILERELPLVCEQFRPDIIFYVAGSDPYEEDTIGDLNLTREQMVRRNMFVYNRARENKRPIVVVAGGGYGKDSWHIYYDFLEKVLSQR